MLLKRSKAQQYLIFLLMAGYLLLCPGCQRQQKAEFMDIEVSPDHWIRVKRVSTVDEASGVDKGHDRLVIQWLGKEVIWESVCLPLCVRQWKNQLYVIGFNRTDPDKCRFEYFRQEGSGFEQIPPKDFPKQIASQNMRICTDSRIGEGGRRYTQLDLTRRLDVDDIYFHRTLTSQIWRHLEKGEDYYEQGAELDEETVKEYKRKYQPIALPTIVKTAEKPDDKGEDKPSVEEKPK